MSPSDRAAKLEALVVDAATLLESTALVQQRAIDQGIDKAKVGVPADIVSSMAASLRRQLAEIVGGG